MSQGTGPGMRRAATMHGSGYHTSVCRVQKRFRFHSRFLPEAVHTIGVLHGGSTSYLSKLGVGTTYIDGVSGTSCCACANGILYRSPHSAEAVLQPRSTSMLQLQHSVGRCIRVEASVHF